MQEGDQAWLIGEAAFSLRALGRLGEALEPMRAGAEMGVRQEDWKNAASGYSNLSELELSLGRTQEAVADAKRSVAYADRSGDAFQRISKRSTLADARHQAGEIEAARKSFVEAESLQAKDQPDYPLLYSLQGFQYCDLLLAGAERAVWVGIYSDKGARLTADVGINSDPRALAKRAAPTLAWAEMNDMDKLSAALDHLTLARCALYADLLQGRPPGAEAQSQTETAVAGLRAAGDQTYISLGLLTRARLFRDRSQLTQARALIQDCGYGRRLPELEDAEAAARDWA